MVPTSQQEFTILPTEIFHRYVIDSTSVKSLPTKLPMEYVRRLTFRR